MLATSLPLAARAALDPRRLRAWLAGRARGPEGIVWSWVDANHPGFDYPEAAGLWLAAMAEHDPAAATAVAHRLGPAVARGQVGRDGRAYAFDLGVALAGLLHARTAAVAVDPRWCDDGRAALLRAFAARCGVRPSAPARWSTQWGPHLLKLAFVLHAVEADEAVARLEDDFVRGPGRARSDGRFATNPDDDGTYLHAHCYATEGLWCLAHRGTGAAGPARDAFAASARWLAAVQRPDGALPAHHDGVHGHGPGRTDATAQAIRIWALDDRARWAEPIERGLGFVAAHVGGDGGLRYDTATSDRTTWSAVFTLQALHLASTPAPESTRVLW